MRVRGYEIEDTVLTASEGEAARLDEPLNRVGMHVLWWGSFALLVLFGARVFFLSVTQGGYYQNIAKGNSIQSIPVPAPRGTIVDRHGEVLATSTPTLSVVVSGLGIPPEGGERERFVDDLAKILHLTREEISSRIDLLETAATSRVILKPSLTEDEALVLSEKQNLFPGVTLEGSAKRSYEDSLIFSHIIGYQAPVTREDVAAHPDYLLIDSIGKSGLEKEYEEALRGTHGAKRAEVNARGRVEREIASTPAVPGSSITLSIDAGLQKKLFDTLSDELASAGLTKGAAVAMNPQTGEVLALVSIPSYDNNLFSGPISPEVYKQLFQTGEQPLFNRVVAGAYPPGSTLKPFIAYAALKEGVITEHTAIESRGSISVGNFTFKDWKAHGFTDVRHAIAVSSDVFFYSIGGGYGSVRGMGMTVMKMYEQLFGFGETTGIDLPNENAGFIPDEAWKEKTLGEKWYVGNSYHASIGQGYIQTTPLQLAVGVSAIANGGTLWVPHIVSRITSPEGEVTDIPAEVKREHIFDSAILRTVREGMRLTVTEGTAKALGDLPVAVAGKTGTAQYGVAEKAHGWFESFAPYDKPAIAMVVLVEGQDEDGYHAVPVTKKVLEWYFSK